MFSKNNIQQKTYKVVTLGSSGVGKTSLMVRFVQDVFTEQQSSTIGASFLMKRLELTIDKGEGVDAITNAKVVETIKNSSAPSPVPAPAVENHNIMFEIFDTAGQERYESLAPMYYRSARVAIIIYDVTNKDTWERAQRWVSTLEEELVGANKSSSGYPILIVILGNKVDLSSSKEVSSEELRDFVKSKSNILAYETSAKMANSDDVKEKVGQSTDKVSTIFTDIAKKLIEIDKTTTANVGIDIAKKTIKLKDYQNQRLLREDNIFKRLMSPCSLL